jgi:Ca2+-binding EF-hand superfamily protein
MLERLDTSRQGVVSRTEVLRGMKKIGVKLPPSELTKLLRAFDASGDGHVMWREFCSMLKAEAPMEVGVLDSAGRARGTPARGAVDSQAAAPVSEPDVAADQEASRLAASAAGAPEALGRLAEELQGRGEEVFMMLERLDTSGQGVVSRTEVLRGMKKLGVILPAAELTKVLRSFDENGDGQLHCGIFFNALYGNVQSGSQSRDESHPNRVPPTPRTRSRLRLLESDLAVREVLGRLADEMRHRGEDVMSTLNRIDRNQNGVIEVSELSGFLRSRCNLGLYPSEEALAMIAFDSNHDGEVQLEELYSVMMDHAKHAPQTTVPRSPIASDASESYATSNSLAYGSAPGRMAPSPTPIDAGDPYVTSNAVAYGQASRRTPAPIPIEASDPYVTSNALAYGASRSMTNASVDLADSKRSVSLGLLYPTSE